MIIKIICENCGSEVELSPETDGNLCYVRRRLNKANIGTNVVIENEITTDIDDIKELNNVDDIDIKSELNSITVTCNNCCSYIELNELNE